MNELKDVPETFGADYNLDAPDKPFKPPLMERLRVRWHNWKVRKVGRAWRTIEKAMRDDPEYRQTIHANLAMPIFDANNYNNDNPMTIARANYIADRLMSHLFPRIKD
jgi:hypothetical protein